MSHQHNGRDQWRRGMQVGRLDRMVCWWKERYSMDDGLIVKSWIACGGLFYKEGLQVTKRKKLNDAASERDFLMPCR